MKRSINQIRQLAQKLINLHPPSHTDEELGALVTRLTTEFYSHQHLIGRREARDRGLPLAEADAVLEQLLLDYYNELRVDLQLGDPFNPASILRTGGGSPAAPAPAPSPLGTAPAVTAAPSVLVPIMLERGYVETAVTCDAFITRGAIGPQTIMTPNGAQQAIAFDIHTEKWEVVA